VNEKKYLVLSIKLGTLKTAFRIINNLQASKNIP